MNTKRTLAGMTTLAIAACAIAQSDGNLFDAAVVLTPGLALERNGIVQTGTFQSGLLQHGDILYTQNFAAGRFHILTSDGTVIGLTGGTTVVIDGRRIGFDVFQVVNGGADILGNVNDGYPVPAEFSIAMPFRIGNLLVQPSPNPFFSQILLPRTQVFTVQL